MLGFLNTVTHVRLAAMSGTGKNKIRARSPGLRWTVMKLSLKRGAGVPARRLPGAGRGPERKDWFPAYAGKTAQLVRPYSRHKALNVAERWGNPATCLRHCHSIRQQVLRSLSAVQSPCSPPLVAHRAFFVPCLRGEAPECPAVSKLNHGPR